MPIIGDKPSTGFTQCPNHIIYDPNLSMKAKLMWIYLYSKPKEYQFSFDRIAKDMKEGESTVKSTLKELETYGLLERKKLKTGRIVYNLFFKPKVKSLTLGQKPKVKKAKVQKSLGGKSNPISNTDIYNNTDNINKTDRKPLKKKKFTQYPFSYVEEMTQGKHSEDIAYIAKHYSVRENVVIDTAESMVNWVYSKNKYDAYFDWRRALMDWIRKSIKRGEIKKIGTAANEDFDKIMGIN